MQLSEIISAFEHFAPLDYQESYDNTGLILGDPDEEINGALLTVDVTDEVIEEAVRLKYNLVISHHPLIFSAIKRLSDQDLTGRVLIKAIRHNIALYAVHTNLDNVIRGVNAKICEKINLKNNTILVPATNRLSKLVTFVPAGHAENIRKAVFGAGAGHIGEYDRCSYNIEGTGTFRGSENTDPWVGEKGKLHHEKEIRIETIFPNTLQSGIISALINAHPYEEVAYDIYPLSNNFNNAGSGMKGEFPEALQEKDFLGLLKERFSSACIRHSRLLGKPVKKVAVCGGSGSFLIHNAIAARVDAFITADMKYHQFFDADGKIVIADIGHYESEQFTKEIFYELLTKKFPNFAVRFSEINTNSINYF